jgi:hypothetical protein
MELRANVPNAEGDTVSLHGIVIYTIKCDTVLWKMGLQGHMSN